MKNKARVEGSICEAYIREEIALFCSLYFEPDIATRLTRPPRNDDGGDVDSMGRLSIFKHSGRPIGGTKNNARYLSQEDYDAASIYVLMNCEEIVSYTE